MISEIRKKSVIIVVIMLNVFSSLVIGDDNQSKQNTPMPTPTPVGTPTPIPTPPPEPTLEPIPEPDDESSSNPAITIRRELSEQLTKGSIPGRFVFTLDKLKSGDIVLRRLNLQKQSIDQTRTLDDANERSKMAILGRNTIILSLNDRVKAISVDNINKDLQSWDIEQMPERIEKSRNRNFVVGTYINNGNLNFGIYKFNNKGNVIKSDIDHSTDLSNMINLNIFDTDSGIIITVSGNSLSEVYSMTIIAGNSVFNIDHQIMLQDSIEKVSSFDFDILRIINKDFYLISGGDCENICIYDVQEDNSKSAPLAVGYVDSVVTKEDNRKFVDSVSGTTFTSISFKKVNNIRKEGDLNIVDALNTNNTIIGIEESSRVIFLSNGTVVVYNEDVLRNLRDGREGPLSTAEIIIIAVLIPVGIIMIALLIYGATLIYGNRNNEKRADFSLIA